MAPKGGIRIYIGDPPIMVCVFTVAPQPNPLPSLVSKHVAARAVRMDVHMSKQRLLQITAVHEMHLWKSYDFSGFPT